MSRVTMDLIKQNREAEEKASGEQSDVFAENLNNGIPKKIPTNNGVSKRRAARKPAKSRTKAKR